MAESRTDASHHRRSKMKGNDPHEEGRTASPLELLFDLSFAIAFGQASSGLAHMLAGRHVSEGLVAFCVAMIPVIWAWVNFTWFASAFDTDDWVYRLLTMVQMIGVVILSLGIKPMYASLTSGGHVDNEVMVAGYIVMRVSMIFQWWRASRETHDDALGKTARMYAITISVAQIGWTILTIARTSVTVWLIGMVVLIGIEMLGPWLAERQSGTPWHPHHMAERYGLLVIIALGECIIGTVSAVTAIIETQGWSKEAVLIAVAGVGLAFAMWWLYFVMPSGEILHASRDKAFPWAYLHALVFMSIAAIGAGLDVAAMHLEHHAKVNDVETMIVIAVPMVVYLIVWAVLYTWLLGWNHAKIPGDLVALAIVGGSILAVRLAAPLEWGLLILTLAPVPIILLDELVESERRDSILDSMDDHLVDTT